MCFRLQHAGKYDLMIVHFKDMQELVNDVKMRADLRY
jgi:hypothetical protein